VPTYVASIAQDGKTFLERAEVTVEQLDPHRWRGRFFVPAGMRLLRAVPVQLAFADGRHGRARVDHVHPALSKRGPRLAEISGAVAIS
jgi:hypothetical protein